MWESESQPTLLLFEEGLQYQSCRPLLPVLLAVATGIVASSLSPRFSLLLLPLLIVSTLYFLLTKRKLGLWIAGFIAFMLTGGLRFQQVINISTEDVSRYAPVLIRVTGVVQSDYDLYTEKQGNQPKRARVLLEVREVEMISRTEPGTLLRVPASGKIEVNLGLSTIYKDTDVSRNEMEARLPHYGDVLTAKGRLERPEEARNPGSFDYRAFLAQRGIYATLYARKLENWQVLSGQGERGNPLMRAAYYLREQILSYVRRVFPPREASILNGILLGIRNELPAEVQDDFERTGVMHILATAGLHVGIVTWLLLGLFRLCRMDRKPAHLLTFVFLLLYMLMAGGRPSVSRAVLMASLYLWAVILEREPDALNTLAAAALCLLLFNPASLFDPGFQMSFATVLTLLLFMPLASPALRQIARSVRGNWPGAKFVEFLIEYVVASCVVSLFAQIGVAPLIAYYFNSFSLISVFTNTVVVPFVPVIIACGFLGFGSVRLFALLALPLNILVLSLLRGILWVVQSSSGLPFATYSLASPPPVFIVVYYLVIWYGAWQIRKQRDTNRAI